MRGRAGGWLACALGLWGCGSSQVGSEGAGETTAMSGDAGLESSTGESGEPMDCGSITIHREYIPSIAMFVVDTSSSMLAQWDHDGDINTPTQTRYASARQLVEVLAHSGPGPAVLGLQRFPSAEACAVASGPEVALAEQDVATLLAALPEPQPDASSPAADAYASALAHILVAWEQPSPAYVVLVSDGRFNCDAGFEQLLASVSEAYAEHGIVTLVVAVDEAADPALEMGTDSIPGFDPRPALQQLGLAGGGNYGDPWGAAYFSASDLGPIAHALDDQIIDEPTCELHLDGTSQGPPSPEQIELVTWTIDGEPIPYVEPEACGSHDGWTWLEPGLVVMFCGQACDAMQSADVIEGHYGCP